MGKGSDYPTVKNRRRGLKRSVHEVAIIERPLQIVDEADYECSAQRNFHKTSDLYPQVL